MEDRSIFIGYQLVWCVYLVAVYLWANEKRLDIVGVTASHAIPTAVAIAMTYVFQIKGGVTIAQIAAITQSGGGAWSLWVRLWPLLIALSAASGICSLVWTIIVGLKRSTQRWLPITTGSVIMSAFALITVGVNFPDA